MVLRNPEIVWNSSKRGFHMQTRSFSACRYLPWLRLQVYRLTGLQNRSCPRAHAIASLLALDFLSESSLSFSSSFLLSPFPRYTALLKDKTRQSSAKSCEVHRDGLQRLLLPRLGRADRKGAALHPRPARRDSRGVVQGRPMGLQTTQN